MSHSSLITGPERRRRWRDDEKHAILMAACSPGAIVVEVAQTADSDDAAHLFRDDRAHHSEMMPPIRGVFVGGLI
jgi:transposase-like protein